MSKRLRSFGTHDGSFHADEVTAAGLLLLYDCIDRDKIIRTRDPLKLAECEYVCDVGGSYDPDSLLFDHHQSDYNGEMSSAGMIWKFLHDTGKVSDLEYRFFHEALIIGVDAHDNGKTIQEPGVCTYSHIVSNFLPIPHDSGSEAQDRGFSMALDFAIGHLQRVKNRFDYIQSCRATMVEALKQKTTCLIFDHRIPWLELFFELDGESHPAEFMIMPSGEHWTLRGIPPTYEDRMSVRFPLPEEWAGLLDEDLKRVSGISGAIFCHKGRFISVWETKEDALKALDYILKIKGEKS